MLRREVAGDPAVVGGAMADLLAAGGKRLRPALVLLAAQLGEYDPEMAATAAMAVEITHAATLVHDDVIDRARLRRGRPTVAAAHGNEAAIVVGDYYLVKAYELLARTGSTEAVAILALAVMEICAGEVRQYGMRHRYSLSDHDYLQWIHDKTASLLAACCDIGALLGGLDVEQRRALHDYGIHLGLAFQIADDVIDYTGSEDQTGKPVGHDLVEGFATLPLMIAQEQGVIERIADGTRLEAAQAQGIVSRIQNSDAPAIALERAREYAAKAREQLGLLRDNEALRTLSSLTESVVSRTF